MMLSPRRWASHQLHDRIEHYKFHERQIFLAVLLVLTDPVGILRAWRHPELPLPDHRKDPQ